MTKVLAGIVRPGANQNGALTMKAAQRLRTWQELTDILRIPRHGGHRFRFIAATDSDSSRPPIPTHRGQSFERMIVIAG
jgi:hypothetical protein